MHLIVTIDLGRDMFQRSNPGAEVARILRDTAHRLCALHDSEGALHHENPEQLYLLDSTGAMVGYVSTVEIDDLTSATQDRIIQRTTAAAAG